MRQAAYLLLALAAAPAAAAELAVAPGGDSLARALAGAAAGDVLHLQPGRHAGGLTIDRAVTLAGAPGAEIVGPGEGNVLTLDAPGIVVRGLRITGSGLSLATEDSGVFVTERAVGARVEDNRIEDNLIGVYLKGAEGAVVRGNDIVGRHDLRMNERGNGVQVWNAPGAAVERNRIRHGRDGIFVTTSRRNAFRDNSFRDLRFGVHYMYTNDGEISRNRSYGNHAGYALMYSSRLRIADNLSEGDRDHGILLNFANSSTIASNRVHGGAEKCVFIYNSNKNDFRDNHFEGCGIGVHFTAGSEGNAISGNAFVGNRTQVKYVGTRHIEWSAEGRGNYWSDATAFDMDGDGIADTPYRPNDFVDQIVWRHPLAKLLLSSPAMQTVRWAQAVFPSFYPGGVVDSRPLMVPPPSHGTEG